jgi:hypothetical protein
VSLGYDRSVVRTARSSYSARGDGIYLTSAFACKQKRRHAHNRPRRSLGLDGALRKPRSRRSAGQKDSNRRSELLHWL